MMAHTYTPWYRWIFLYKNCRLSNVLAAKTCSRTNLKGNLRLDSYNIIFIQPYGGRRTRIFVVTGPHACIILFRKHTKICACNELSSSGLILFMHKRSIPHDLFAPTCIFRLILLVLSVEQPKLLSLIIRLVFDFHEKQKESYMMKKC